MATAPSADQPTDTNQWIKGTTYPYGSVLRPGSSPAAVYEDLVNGDFEDGFNHWTQDHPGWFTMIPAGYIGTACPSLPAGYGGAYLQYDKRKVIPGQKISADCFFNPNGSTSCVVDIAAWFYADDGFGGLGAQLSQVGGKSKTTVVIGANKTVPPGWYAYGLTDATAPADAAWVVLAVGMSNPGANPVYVDAVTWKYYAPNPDMLIFYAVSTAVGAKSGQIEPTWHDTTKPWPGPTDPIQPIHDGEILWSSTPPGTILWRAFAIATTGFTPVTWPTVVGTVVRDGTIDWVCETPQVIDLVDPTLPPQSRFVFIAASKVFALDGDIAPYSATLDPTNWKAEADAGYLPIGLRAFGTNPFTAVGVYRSNAVFLNAEGLQMWQVDEDPANMAMLDAIPVGCTRHRSIASVNDDMLYLSAQGVRSMGISAGSGNLQAGDVGMPVDPLVIAAMNWADANGIEPIGGYFPSLGQYFLAFPNWPGADPRGGSLFWSYGGSGTATGTNAYTVDIAGVDGYTPGVYYLITFTNGSTGGCTLNIINTLHPAPAGNGPRLLSGLTGAIQAGATWMVTYDASNGRFFITDVTRVMVYTMGRTGEVGSWSHYLFQYQIEAFVQAGDNLYMRGLRDGQSHVFMFDQAAVYDQLSYPPFTSGINVESWGCVQWPWLDDGQPGVTKQLSGLDLAVTTTASFSVAIGYDQVNKNVFTTPHFLFGDTVTGMMVPIQVKAPSFSMRLVFDAAGNWSVQATELYLTDKRITS